VTTALQLIWGFVIASALPASVSAFAAVGGGQAGESPAQTIEVTASRYKFEPAVIEVPAGRHLRLVLRSADTTHGLAIEALDVEVVIPKGGEPVTVELVPGRPGRYPFKCSEYCGSGHKRMRGELVVTEEGQ